MSHRTFMREHSVKHGLEIQSKRSSFLSLLWSTVSVSRRLCAGAVAIRALSGYK